jgi:PAS domain S-box-containing protein
MILDDHPPSDSYQQPIEPAPDAMAVPSAEAVQRTEPAGPADEGDRPPAHGADGGKETESRFRAIVELAPDATVVADREGCIAVVNRQAELLFGYARAELLGLPVDVLIPERFHTAHRQHRAGYMAAPRARPMGVDLQLFGRRRDGSDFPVEVSLSPLEGDRELAVIASIRDASALQRIHAAQAAAEAANQELGRLQALTDTALSHLDLQDLLRELLGRVTAVLGVDNVAILLLDADGQALTLQAARGPEEEQIGAVHIPLGQGFAGRIAASQAPLVVDDTADYELVNPLLREKMRSLAGVPLMVDGRPVGVVHVGSSTPRHFTPADVELLQRAVDRIALAIDRANAYEAAQVARAEAERQAELLEGVFEAVTDALGVYDAQGRMVRDNAALRRLRGANSPPPEYFQMPLVERLALYGLCDGEGHPVAPEDAPIMRALRGEVLTGADAMDMRLRTLDGREVELRFSAAPLRDRDGHIIGAVGSGVDLTEHNRLVREREEARSSELAVREVNERLDTFLATAAHDLRSPVAVSKLWAEGAQRVLDQAAATMRRSTGEQFSAFAQVALALQTIDQSLDRLWRLVDQLLNVVRIRSGVLVLDRQPCRLAELVRDCVEEQRLLAPTRQITLELPDLGGRPVVVNADADRLRQVLTNYLTNAVRYSPEDRPIEVTLRVAEAAEAADEAEEAEPATTGAEGVAGEAGTQGTGSTGADTAGGPRRAVARVEVRDHGFGISPEEQESIWSRFQRARGVSEASGLGLGLYIARMLIELHGGEVGMESVLGQGSTFWYTIPLSGVLAAVGTPRTPSAAEEETA